MQLWVQPHTDSAAFTRTRQIFHVLVCRKPGPVAAHGVATSPVCSSRNAVRRPRRLPVAGSTPKLSRTPERTRNFSSEWVSGASSEVASRNLFGTESLRIVQNVCMYWCPRDPVVYGRSYLSHRGLTRSDISAYRLLGRSGNRWCSIW